MNLGASSSFGHNHLIFCCWLTHVGGLADEQLKSLLSIAPAIQMMMMRARKTHIIK